MGKIHDLEKSVSHVSRPKLKDLKMGEKNLEEEEKVMRGTHDAIRLLNKRVD